ncbi:sugar ABC transporter permease [Saccharopolyspora sp. K220]|uniref:ABC transporter permease n=1 Tax=Saccharopolyspora soli TaxID=2926618 RepID=UPI001F589A1D|nr:sugar ABC transporter permease [Saccharopolyspora soli]MCI2417835.1 sugar ABC transporter permease [Saccharopolyspora soli]
MSSAVSAPSRPGPDTRPTSAPVLSWLHRRGFNRLVLMALPGVIFMILFFIYPLFYGVGLSFQGEGGLFSTYHRFFADPYLRDSVWITLRLSVPAALINVLASIPLAYRMRHPMRGKQFLTALLLVPMTLGTVFVAQGMLDFLGPDGWFNQILLLVGLIDEPVVLIHNTAGVLISMIISGFPFAFLLVLGYIGGIDPNLEKAAAVLGARPAQRFRMVLLPLLLPGLTITFCLSFVMSFAVFPSATLVGDPSGTTHVISIVAYEAAYQNIDYAFASAVTVIMALVELVVLGLVMLGRGRLYRGTSSGGKG